jgi:hypothetical protein
MRKEKLFKHGMVHANFRREPSVLSRVRKKDLGRGYEEKNTVEANISRGIRQRKVFFIERLMRDRKMAEAWIKKWKILHDLDLPIPPTIRISQKNNIFITNLRANGEEMYGKGLLWEARKMIRERRGFKPRAIDEIFFKIWLEKRGEILGEVWRLTDIANEAGVFLPTDDAFELLVSPDGSWRLVIVDLFCVSKLSKDPFKGNNKNVSQFISHLDGFFKQFAFAPTP